MPKEKAIEVIRGNATTFGGQPPIELDIDSPLDLTDFTGTFTFGSITKEVPTEEIVAKHFRVEYTSDETKTFFPGRGFGTLTLVDTESKSAIVQRYLFNVIFPWDKKSLLTNRQ